MRLSKIATLAKEACKRPFESHDVSHGERDGPLSAVSCARVKRATSKLKTKIQIRIGLSH